VDAWIGRIYLGKAPWTARQSARREKLDAVHALLGGYPRAADAWYRLLSRVGQSAERLSVEPAVGSLGARPGNTAIDGLLMLALRYDQWLRPPESWTMPGDDAAGAFGSLARHLLCRYSVPEFMNCAWFEGFSPAGRVHQDWFVHVGGGGNIRRADLPLRLTERAAHHFLLAPPESTIVGALRFGQARALGGSRRLACAIAASRLSAILPDEPFWHTVIHFLVNQQDLDLRDVGPVVDFLVAAKLGEEVSNGSGESAGCYVALEPQLVMKGRTLPALLRRVAEWRQIRAQDERQRGICWRPCGIASYRAKDRDANDQERTWEVRELLVSRELLEEGKDQRNCVFTYRDRCTKGAVSIWSLRICDEGDASFRRVLTIEVDNRHGAIVQVRCKCNRLLSSAPRSERLCSAGEVLRRWAHEARLAIACGT